MAKLDSLPEKYLKALSLIEQDKLSYLEIAKACKIGSDTFYNLIEGTHDSKNIQDKFTERLTAINKKIDRDIRQLTKSCRKNTFRLIDEYLKKHPKIDKNDKSLIATITSIANSLGKVTPNVEIGSFSYTKGLSPEDIYAEFKRLSGLASDRGTIQSSSATGTGEIPVPARPGSPITEESENPLL